MRPRPDPFSDPDLTNTSSGTALPFERVQKEVAEIIEGKIIVGHGLENDMKALLLAHPFAMTRDTAKYRPLQRKKNRPHSLKWLARNHLNIEIQKGEHDPVRINYY